MQAEAIQEVQQNHKQPTLAGLTKPISETQNDSLQAEEFIGKIQRGETTIAFLLSFHSIRWLFAEHFNLNPTSPIPTLHQQIRTCIDQRTQATLN